MQNKEGFEMLPFVIKELVDMAEVRYQQSQKKENR